MNLILQRFRDYLLLVAQRRMRPRLRAKFGASDVVQRGMLDASASIGMFRGSSEAEMRQWLKKIVVHTLIDETRRYTSTDRRRLDRELVAPNWCAVAPRENEPSHHVCCQEDDERLLLAIDRLPARQRYVVEARHKEGRSYADIAARLETTEGAARKLMARAIDELRIQMESGV
ncbi:MAG: sigma-70 family RNA polymerase sigma factor [Planctomycetaceae bacterium]